MTKVTVVIPTANRPAFLRAAIQSVASQTGVGRIEKVIVSENGGNHESGRVCAAFADRLPIEYCFREAATSAVDHVARLFDEAEGDFLAFLCDDDWWMSGHLENSLGTLEKDANAAAAFSASLHVESESANAAEIYRPAPLRVAAGGEMEPAWRALARDQVLAAAWLCTPFHFSSMVARTSALKRANALMRAAHPNWADRILEAGLAMHGTILYYPQPEIGIRMHAGNWRSGRKEAEMLASDREGTRQVESLAGQAGLDLAAFWAERLPGVSPAWRNELANRFLPLLDLAGLKKRGLHAALFPSKRFLAMKIVDYYLSRYLRPWIPPVLLGWHRQLKRRAG
jgi:glycosyltransferase involved in cell wall biosynthesis